MTFFVDLNWQDYEIEKEEPAMKNGKPVLRDGSAVKNVIRTGVKMQIKPLNYEANQQMLAFAQKQATPGEELSEDNVAKNLEQSMAMMNDPELPNFMKRILPPHVKDFSGVEMIGEGETERRAATIQDIVDNGCFMTISLAIFTKLSQISNMTEEKGKQLKKK